MATARTGPRADAVKTRKKGCMARTEIVYKSTGSAVWGRVPLAVLICSLTLWINGRDAQAAVCREAYSLACAFFGVCITSVCERVVSFSLSGLRVKTEGRLGCSQPESLILAQNER